MNKFVSHRSFFAVAIAWLFLAANFLDMVNFTDLFTETVTIHFEESVDNASSDAGYSMVIARVRPVKQNFEREKHPVLKHILYDQDSPSLAANDRIVEESTAFSPTRDKAPYHHIETTSSLFLRHCTLLI